MNQITAPRRGLRRVRQVLVLAVVLALTALVVPQGGVRRVPFSLVKVRTASAVDHPRDVIWILCLGSDARPGQAMTSTRADAIQLVGINLRTGAATDIGVPRDSFVNIPGHGRNKINSAMAFGGPQLMAQAVGNLVGIHPDYVFAAGFFGFRHMIRAIGGVTVYSKFAFSDPVRPQGYHHGKNRLTPFQALIFARVRHALPRGDFDRSHDQQSLMKGILREVRRKQDQPGFMERGVLSVFKNMNTDLRPSELYTLAQAATRIQPRKYRGCVINGSTGYVGAMSVVYPDVGEARNIARRVRRDATLEGPC